MNTRFSVRRLVVCFSVLAHAVLGVSPARAAEPYVLVSTQGSIYKFDLEGNSLGTFIESTAPGVAQPQHMAVGPDGNLYVANWVGNIEVYDLQTGDHVRTVASGAEYAKGTFLTFHEDKLVVGSFGTDRILRYDVMNNDRLLNDLIPKAGSFFRDPHQILFLDNGEMLVSMAAQVARFGADGTYLGAFTSQGINQATGAVVVGDSLVVNNYYGQSNRYDLATGALLGEFNLDGRGDGGDGAILLPDGTVLLAYNLSPYVLRYDVDGNFLNVWASKVELGSSGPNGILLVVPAAPSAGLLGAGILLASRRRR